jgi:hypothetical protein
MTAIHEDHVTGVQKIARCREIVRIRESLEIDGKSVSPKVAQIFCRVYDCLRPTNRQKLEILAEADIDLAIRAVADMVRRARKGR